MASIWDLGSGDLASSTATKARRPAPGGYLGILTYYEAALDVGESVLKPKPTRLTRLKLTPKRKISHLDACIFVFLAIFCCLKIAKFSLKSAERAATRAW